MLVRIFDGVQYSDVKMEVALDLPYISCSSIGSTSSSSLSDSETGPGGAKGSLRYVDDGIVLAKRPRECLFELWEELLRCRRVGRSEALRIVGLALRISAIAGRCCWCSKISGLTMTSYCPSLR